MRLEETNETSQLKAICELGLDPAPDGKRYYKDIIRSVDKLGVWIVDEVNCIGIKFPEVSNCSTVILEDVLVLWKYTLKYLGMKRPNVYNFYFYFSI